MKDTIIKGTGDSRYLKSAIPADITHEQLVALLRDGTFPVDLAGVNPAGMQQVGDALNKATFLKDATAALYGLGAEAVPDEVLRILSRFQAGLGNEYVWRKQHDEYEYLQEARDNPGTSYTSNWINFAAWRGTVYYADTFTTIKGTYVLDRPVKCDTTYADPNILKGKYLILVESGVSNRMYYIDPASRVIFSNSYGCAASKGVIYTIRETLGVVDGYVNSPNSDAYPPRESDGFEYRSLGQLGDSARIETGSYVGTGTFGEANKNRLIFQLEPKLVLCCRKDWSLRWSTGGNLSSAGWSGSFLWFEPNKFVPVHWNSYSGCTFEKDANTLSWYSDGAGNQLNEASVTYNYLAIGV